MIYDDGLSDKAFDKLIESDAVHNDITLNAEGLKALDRERRSKGKRKKAKKEAAAERSAIDSTMNPPEWYADVSHS